MTSQWETVIGLEIHAQLMTSSKLFSGSPASISQEANAQASAIDLGMPGTLPVLNQEAVMMAIKFGLATNAEICNHSTFSRKHYFYPDLPKGYQITQHEKPLLRHGTIDILLATGEKKTIHLPHAHLEEDAGKSRHEDIHGMTGIDFNRAGEPLLEIVTAPELYSAEEASACLKAIHTLVKYLNICDGYLHDGSFRCDANVSVRKKGDTDPMSRTEIKNLNSFRYLERAIEFESKRQINLLTTGKKVAQETRFFNVKKNRTERMRKKEKVHDYCYFPEPDLLPIEIDSRWVTTIKNSIAELPLERYRRFLADYKILPDEAKTYMHHRELGDYFEATLRETTMSPKNVSTWILGELSALLNKQQIPADQSPVSPDQLAGLLNRIIDGTLSRHLAKQILETMAITQKSADDIIAENELSQVTNESDIQAWITEVIETHPKEIAEYRAGKKKLLGFLIGQVMRRSHGRANPKIVAKLITTPES